VRSDLDHLFMKLSNLLTLLRKSKKSLKKLLVVTYVTFYGDRLPYVCIENQTQDFRHKISEIINH